MRIVKSAAYAVLLAFVMVLSACGPRDLQIDRKEWANLSPEEQAAIQAEYHDMLDAKRELKEKDRIRGQTRTLSNRGLGVRPESNNPVKDCCI